MITVSKETFEELVNRAISSLPKAYVEKIKNVAFIVEDEPSLDQRISMHLGPHQTLFGLYEGTPLTQRQGMTKLLPDKITIFKKPIEYTSADMNQLYERVGRTVWHEVAHYFGLDHQRIYDLEAKEKDGKS
jgi:predicted Zn-dependent protease with MMP-like domain